MREIITLLMLFIGSVSFSEETHVLLIRHGRTEWNHEGRIQGRTNNPLNEEGIEQAKILSEILGSEHSDVAVIYSSDLDRAYATAFETARKFGLVVEEKSAFTEKNAGEAEGLLHQDSDLRWGQQREQLKKQYPDLKEQWNYTVVPGEESRNQVLARAKPELLAIAEKHQGKKIAVFTHGAVISVILVDSKDGDVNLALNKILNCSISEFKYIPGEGFQFIKLCNYFRDN